MTAKLIAPTVRASPSFQPKTWNDMVIAMTLIAGPEYRKLIAGPRPAPFL